MTSSTAFYLKLNRYQGCYQLYFAKWIEIVQKYGCDYYILCDDENIIKNIKLDFEFIKDSQFIVSYREEFEPYVVKTFAEKWYNAAMAHLTLFKHSKEHNYKNFWNIDVDDNAFLLPIDEIVRILKDIKRYADGHDGNAYSYDVWRSRSNKKHWSFGTTYTKNKIDWLDIFFTNYDKQDWLAKNGNFNLDWFLTYLKNMNLAKLETYYIKNVYFSHDRDAILCHINGKLLRYHNKKKYS